MEGIQLNRFLALSGLCSRRKAVELIETGRVWVNKITCKEPGYRVKDTDLVHCDTIPVKKERPAYVLLNKPVGVVSTRSDEMGRPTVIDLCSQVSGGGARLFPVGRLDSDSRGLLLLTNDGDVANALAHPRMGVTKRYLVTLHEPVCPDYLDTMRTGMYLKDGYARVDRIIFKSRDRRTVEIWLHSGRNRIIRRMLAHGGFHVRDLTRISYGSLYDPRLKSGSWRYLTREEIDSLRSYSAKSRGN